jgi:hypothetical protein
MTWFASTYGSLIHEHSSTDRLMRSSTQVKVLYRLLKVSPLCNRMKLQCVFNVMNMENKLIRDNNLAVNSQ